MIEAYKQKIAAMSISDLMAELFRLGARSGIGAAQLQMHGINVSQLPVKQVLHMTLCAHELQCLDVVCSEIERRTQPQAQTQPWN